MKKEMFMKKIRSSLIKRIFSKNTFRKYRDVLWFASVGIAFDLGLISGSITTCPESPTHLKDSEFENLEEVQKESWIGFTEKTKDLED